MTISGSHMLCFYCAANQEQCTSVHQDDFSTFKFVTDYFAVLFG